MTLGFTGATGFIGRRTIDLALRRGHEVVAFTRSPARRIPGCEMRGFSLDAVPDVSGCEVLMHLAGEPVSGIWTAAKKRRIRDSRIMGTRRIVEAIHRANPKPEALICGSAIGYYGDRGEEELTETAGAGEGFLAATCKEWEAEGARATGVRVVFLRTAIVLGRNAGALPLMAAPFRFFAGAQFGDGRQWMPWIHIDDMARLILFAVENMDIRGPLNAAAPWPVRNAEFTHAIARTLHRPAFFRVPAMALRLALGDFSHELLDSKRVLPAVATAHGFRFEFPELPGALKNLLG